MQKLLPFPRFPILAICLLLAACQKEAVSPGSPTLPTGPVMPPQPLPKHLTLGNPSGAVTDINQPTNYLLSKPQYALSYHRDRGIPNWVR